jgi:DNA primase
LLKIDGASFDSLPDDLQEYIFNINKFMILHAQMTLTRIARGMRVRTILERQASQNNPPVAAEVKALSIENLSKYRGARLVAQEAKDAAN